MPSCAAWGKTRSNSKDWVKSKKKTIAVVSQEREQGEDRGPGEAETLRHVLGQDLAEDASADPSAAGAVQHRLLVVGQLRAGVHRLPSAAAPEERDKGEIDVKWGTK